MELVSKAKKSKVHFLIDKVYRPTNLSLAWNKVRENRGAGAVDQISIDTIQENAEEALSRLHEEQNASNYKQSQHDPCPA